MFSILNRFKKKLISFDELREFLDNVPNINRGGCGVSAYSMYCLLEKQKQLKPDTRIIYIHRKIWGDYSTNKWFLDNQEGNADSASHVILFHDGYYLDSSEEFTNLSTLIDVFFTGDKESEFDILDIPQQLTHIFMKSSLENGSWNDSFDTKNIEVIENKLGFKLNIEM